jgi:predicted RND superfamily exporter protein
MTVLSQLRNSPEVLALIDSVQAKARSLGLDTTITGRTILTHQFNPEIVPSFFRSMLSGTLVIAFVLLIYFRSLRLAFLGLFLELIPLVVGAGIVFWLLGKNFEMGTIGTFSIVLGVTVDDTVHFMHGYGKLRKEGHAPEESVTRLWPTVATGMLIAQLILAACFATFVTIVFPIIRYMGIQVASMLVIAFLANVTLSPALLLLLGKRKAKA